MPMRISPAASFSPVIRSFDLRFPRQSPPGHTRLRGRSRASPQSPRRSEPPRPARQPSATPFTISAIFSGTFLPAGNVVQEKQGLSPGAGHIVHAHRHAVNAHRIMLIHQKCQLQHGAHAVRPGQQGGLFHPLKSCHGKCPGESSGFPPAPPAGWSPSRIFP